MSFECHITVPTEYAEKAASIAAALGWKTSEIARDPLLGDKNFFYLTRHSMGLEAIMSSMENCAGFLRDAGVPVLRKKIEVIIYDARYA